MSKQKETPRSSVPNKRKTPALYRKLELLIIDLTKHVDNIPNKPMLSGYISRLSDELMDCLASVKYAYTRQDYKIRYEYLCDMEVHLDLIKSIVGILFEYASTTTSRFMTPEHHSRYLVSLDDIERQRKNWAESTLRSISTETSNQNQYPAQPPFLDLNLDLNIPENSHFMPLGNDRIVNQFIEGQ